MESRPWRRKNVPPMPALIPISALRGGKSPTINDNNNSTRNCDCVSDCVPCDRVKNLVDVIEGRSSGDEHERQSPELSIDFVRSRDVETTRAVAKSRPARTERHRKSDRRRREHRSSIHHRRRSQTTTNITPAEEDFESTSTTNTQPPRVNPIFVWVRQEDTRIVDVRCEDYDKRNRILLTKTAHGWRAIPRTETLSVSIEEKQDKHKHEKTKNGPGRPPKNKKSRRRRDSKTDTEPEIQISESTEPEVAISESPESPWSRVSQDIESHLPSHTITIPKRHRRNSSGEEVVQVSTDPLPEVVSDSVNTDIAQARSQSPESALDTLLAAAEIAFKNQINEQNNSEMVTDSVECDSGEQLNDENDCDYNEVDDDNHFSHVLEKLEQSLQTPDDTQEGINETQQEFTEQSDIQQEFTEQNEIQQEFAEMEETVPEMDEIKPEEYIPEVESLAESIIESIEPQQTEQEDNMDAQLDACETTDISTIDDDMQPTDLSTHSKQPEIESTQPEITEEPLDDLQPTDLSIKKHSGLTIEAICRPPSQNSETIQSPQPSGIPAVPPSPDIISSKQSTAKSVFLESLLSTSPKIALTPEVTITRNQKEPLDLGKGRKSASPTVSCSEEVKNIGEPSPKRIKVEDITLKNLLHADVKNAEVTIKPIPMEKKKLESKDQSSRLLELLTSDSVPDPMTQLKQLLADPHINIPDPMLVPKDRLSHILAAPSKEIPRLLVTRPELRLPEALSHPTLMNDPDILVITMDQLHTILEKHHQPIALEEPTKIPSPKEKIEKNDKQQQKTVQKPAKTVSPSQVNHQAIANDYHRYIQNLQHQQQLMLQEAQIKHHQNQMIRKPGLANDIDAATAASFNQMMWLPYLNQLEQTAQVTGNNQDFLKMLNAVFPNGGYPGPPEVSPMFSSGRFGIPNSIPMQNQIDYNLEMAMWQEAMLRQKIPTPQENYAKQAAYNLEKRNLINKNKYNSSPYYNQMFNLQKQQMQRKTPNFSSARTNPIQHMSEQQILGMKNPFFRPNVGIKQPIQVPDFNKMPSPKKEALKNNPFFSPKEKFVKPPNRFVQEPTSTRNPEPYNPIDLSGSNQPKLKVRTNLMSGGFGFGREEIAEVGSTTEDAMQNLHDNQNHHVWHPLFGK